MYKMDYFYVYKGTGDTFKQEFDTWLKNMGDIQIISHSTTIDVDGDIMVTVIFKGQEVSYEQEATNVHLHN